MGLSAFRHINWIIIACALLVLTLGVFFIYSGSYRLSYDTGFKYAERQIVWAIIGMMVGAFFVALGYRKLSYISFPLYLFFILLLLILLITADPRRGARSWLFLWGLTIQPSEFAKIAVVLALAKYLSGDYFSRGSLNYMLAGLLMTAVPVLLILKQPDLGTAIVLIPIMLAMLVVAGARARYLFYCAIAGILSLPLFWCVLKPYQQLRIKTFLNPQLDPLRSGYNAIQSQIAVGSGGLFGQGWLYGTQTHLRFLPERHTDFVFSVLGEEAGFLGCLLLFLLYAVIIFSGLRIASQARDEFGRLVAVGISVLLASHVIINVGMSIGLLPITGIPLPLMSYGGSSLLSIFICLGILESIYAGRYIF